MLMTFESTAPMTQLWTKQLVKWNTLTLKTPTEKAKPCEWEKQITDWKERFAKKHVCKKAITLKTKRLNSKKTDNWILNLLKAIAEPCQRNTKWQHIRWCLYHMSPEKCKWRHSDAIIYLFSWPKSTTLNQMLAKVWNNW